jgi:hypothetical protein
MKKLLIFIFLAIISFSTISCSKEYYDERGDYADGWGGR